MAGVFDIELDPSHPEGEDGSDEETIDVRDDHVQVKFRPVIHPVHNEY